MNNRDEYSSLSQYAESGGGDGYRPGADWTIREAGVVIAVATVVGVVMWAAVRSVAWLVRAGWI